MLSVAHQPETPGSASKHSALGHSWAPASERSNVLKRRKTEPECRVPDKKPALDSRTYSFSNHPEITLTIIPGKNGSQSRARDLDLGASGFRSNLTIDQEQLTISCTEEDSERTSSSMPPVVLELLENSGEIQLTKLGSKEQVKLSSQSPSESQLSPANESSDKQMECDAREVRTPKRDKSFLENNPIADLSEVTIEPCSSSLKSKNMESPSSPSVATPRARRGAPRTASRLSNARAFLKEKEKDKKTTVTSSFSEKFDSNLKINAEPEQNFDFDAKSDFSAADYEPFNVGIQCDRYYGNSKERPHYAVGFPNPPGENRCWSNATLQALFTLPVLDRLDSLEVPQCSKLMSALIDVQACWRKGNTESHQFDQIFNTYKDELSALDKLYSSKAQQDVSEFIMNLLNFVKTEFEAKSSKESDSSEIENIPNNDQDPSRKSQSGALDSDKRLPLADISASAGQTRNTHSSISSSTKSKDSTEDETNVNLIDEYFSLYMSENYVCESCCKQRQQKVENLMLFIDLPTEDSGAPVDLVDMINTTYALEHRNMTCESCKHEIHSMETKFKKLPKILTVQVKRYEMTNEGVITKKSTMVDIPKCLKLDSLVINNSEDFNHCPEYEPICIISHIGDNIDSGHYISFVKHEDQWFYYDDMNVKVLSADEVFKCVQNNAYVIFFQDSELSHTAETTAGQSDKSESITC